LTETLYHVSELTSPLPVSLALSLLCPQRVTIGMGKRLIGTFNLSAALLLPKALEIERIMRLKVPQGSLKKVELPLEMRQIQIDQTLEK
jgi:hypothetical protein